MYSLRGYDFDETDRRYIQDMKCDGVWERWAMASFRFFALMT